MTYPFGLPNIYQLVFKFNVQEQKATRIQTKIYRCVMKHMLLIVALEYVCNFIVPVNFVFVFIFFVQMSSAKCSHIRRMNR